jgi:hypothetical protein
VHSNLSSAPTASSSREGNCQSDLLLFTVQCAIGQSGASANREGWELPNEAPMAPKPFGAIKGTLGASNKYIRAADKFIHHLDQFFLSLSRVSL